MALIVLASVAVYVPTQDFVNAFDGRGWDGRYYFDVAEQIRRGTIETVWPPYGFRLGHIVIAAFAPIEDLLQSFFVCNLVIAIAGGLLLGIWLQRRIHHRPLRSLAVFVYAWSIHAPVRLTTFYPTNAEPLAFLLIVLNFFAIDAYLRGRQPHWYALVITLAGLGAVTREIALVPAVAFVVAEARLDWTALPLLLRPWRGLPRLLAPLFARDRLKYWAPLLVGLAGFLTVGWLVPSRYQFSFLANAADHATRTNDVRYAASILAMLGPIATVVLFRPRTTFAWFAQRPHFAAYAVAILVFAFVNQPDERYFAYLIPVLFLCADAVLRRHYDLRADPVFWVAAFVFTAVAVRAFLLAPADGIAVPNLPWWQEALARFLPHASDYQGILLYVAPGKTVVAALVVFFLMSWLLWLRAESRSLPLTVLPATG